MAGIRRNRRRVENADEEVKVRGENANEVKVKKIINRFIPGYIYTFFKLSTDSMSSYF